MNTINNVYRNEVSSSEYMEYLNDYASEGDSVMSDGIAVMYKFLDLYGYLAQKKYDQMNAKADRARNSQDVANKVDSIISKMKNPDDVATLPPEVIEYLRQNNIPVSLKSGNVTSSQGIDKFLEDTKFTASNIKSYLKENDLWKDSYDSTEKSYKSNEEFRLFLLEDMKADGIETANIPVKMDKGDLDIIKGALESDSGRCTDYVSQSQLQLQKLFQNNSMSTNSINEMQTLIKSMNEGIIRNYK